MKEYKLKINGNDYAVSITDVEETVAEVEVNGIPFKVEFEAPVKKTVAAPKVSKPAAPAAPAKPTATVATPASTGGSSVTSPLPGVILEVSVKEGDSVKKGQKLIVLEAMKMENVIEANSDGKVTSIKVNKGDSVLEGATLVTIG
ncbi:MAG: biotin/lipoyl-binding protein [Bacteroidales bacterium]|nr:biotin/lipoyl-binding protein [Bacteroidales bacterium]